MIEMLYVLLLEIILIACLECQYTPIDDYDHRLATELARAAAQMSHALCADFVFPGQIENIYRAHGSLLSDIIAHTSETPFVITMRDMADNSLQTLFKKVRPEIDIVCSSYEVQSIFQNIHQQKQQKTALKERVQLWIKFMKILAGAQNNIRDFQLSHLWFPTQADKDNEKEFIVKNSHLVLNKTQKKYLMADTVITFLPLALMVRYDPEVFSAMRLQVH